MRASTCVCIILHLEIIGPDCVGSVELASDPLVPGLSDRDISSFSTSFVLKYLCASYNLFIVFKGSLYRDTPNFRSASMGDSSEDGGLMRGLLR